MQIQIIAIGKIKKGYLRRGLEDYISRLSKYSKVKIIEIGEEDIGSCNPRDVLTKEALKLKKYIPARDSWSIIALDREGVEFSSEQLAENIEGLLIEGKSNFIFIIGGALGLDETIVKTADLCLSLSKLTFTHQIARFILLEQLYRSFKIMRGEPYHY